MLIQLYLQPPNAEFCQDTTASAVEPLLGTDEATTSEPEYMLLYSPVKVSMVHYRQISTRL